MKIKIGKNLRINSNTLIRFEWRKYYPALVIHEKFEKILKWILRSIAFIGIATSLIAIDKWYISLGLTLVIFAIEQFFERTAIEYTTMVIQPFPEFTVQYDQWKTNGFLIPRDRNEVDLAHFGPAYLDEEYAIKFFEYLRSWIDDGSDDDKNNNLVISLIIEPDETYTTCFYANLGRKRLDSMFKYLGDQNSLEKFGKRQQQLIAQMFYWNTLDYKSGSFIKQFLEFHKPEDSYFFTPCVIQPFDLPFKHLTNYSIKKHHLRILKREDLKKTDPEYILTTHREKKDSKAKKKEVQFNNETLAQIQKVFSKTEDVGFLSNEGSTVGMINLCFSDPDLAIVAYGKLLEEKKEHEVFLELEEDNDLLDITIEINSVGQKIKLKNLKYNKAEFDLFRDSKGGGPRVILIIGYPPANERRMLLEKDTSPLIVEWKIK